MTKNSYQMSVTLVYSEQFSNVVKSTISGLSNRFEVLKYNQEKIIQAIVNLLEESDGEEIVLRSVWDSENNFQIEIDNLNIKNVELAAFENKYAHTFSDISLAESTTILRLPDIELLSEQAS